MSADVLPAFVVPTILAISMVLLAARLGIRRATSTEAFFLAPKSMNWWPTGISLGTGGLAAILFCLALAEAYDAGYHFLLAPILVWISLPFFFRYIVPLYTTLDIESVHEYLELRFDPTTRLAATTCYLVGTIGWLGSLLALPCWGLDLVNRLPMGSILVVLCLGATATLLAWCGGIRATIWTNLIKWIVMMGALLILLGALAANLDGGLTRIGEVAESLNRRTVFEPTRDLSMKWNAWVAVPYFAIAALFFFTADQTTWQRLRVAQDVAAMKLAYLLGTALYCVSVVGAMYVGLGLLAVYHDNAQEELQPRWVIQSALDPQTGRPLIRPDTDINADTLPRLVDEHDVLNPNTGRPFTDAAELVDGDGHARIDRLAYRQTRLLGGERTVNARRPEMLMHFVQQHVRQGTGGSVVGLVLMGLVIAGVLAAVLATCDSALIALSTVITVDLHRRFGWGEYGVARRCAKHVDDLDQADELRLGRPAVVLIGAAVTVVGLGALKINDGPDLSLRLLGILAGPLFGLFLLGMGTRRTTSQAATIGLISGVACAGIAAWGHCSIGLVIESKAGGPVLGPFCGLPFGVAATMAVGIVMSRFVGTTKSDEELTGLVMGRGNLGVLPESYVEPDETEEIYWIDTEENGEGEAPSPWS